MVYTFSFCYNILKEYFGRLITKRHIQKDENEKPVQIQYYKITLFLLEFKFENKIEDISRVASLNIIPYCVKHCALNVIFFHAIILILKNGREVNL